MGSLASDTLGHTCQAGSYQDIKARGLFKLRLSFTFITVDCFIKHRYPELKWLFQVGERCSHMIFQLFFPTSSSTGRTALKTHQLHILFSLHANLFKMCSHCLHMLFLFGRSVRENWKRTPGEWQSHESTQKKLTIFLSAPNSECLHSEQTEKRRRLRQL